MMDEHQPLSEDEIGTGVGEPKNVGGQIRFAISLAAHDYVKARTEELTALRKATTETITYRFGDDRLKTSPGEGPSRAYVTAYPERLIEPTPSDGRLSLAYAKDYARIIHSPSFRRLQGKTQLIPTGENDFFRTRLTHSLEVAEVARRIAMRLNDQYKDVLRPHAIDADIVVCAALLHDIGHPPFGHSGEEELNRQMDDYGGFEGNAQTLRIVTKIENRLGRGGSLLEDAASGPRGLNLTVGTLASIIKYDNESTGPTHIGDKVEVNKGYYTSERQTVQDVRRRLGLAESSRRLYTIECQIMDIADDIAYSAYDLEDTLEAGIVSVFDLMSIEHVTMDLVTRDVNHQIGKRFPGLTVKPEQILQRLADVFGTLILNGETSEPYNFENRFDRIVFVGRTYLESQQHAKNPLVRRQYLETLIEENVAALSLEYDPEFPCLSRLHVDPDRLVTIEAMKSFNFHKVISSRRLQLHHYRAQKIVGTIFTALQEDKDGRLLSEYQRQMLKQCAGDEQRRMRMVSDLISGFTDAEATRFYDQLHSSRNQPFMSYTR